MQSTNAPFAVYGSFKKEIQQILAGVAADRFSNFSGTFTETGEYQPPDLFDAAKSEWVVDNGAVDPMTSFTMQLYALWYGMAWLNANYDNTFNDAAQVWVELALVCTLLAACASSGRPLLAARQVCD